MIDASMAVPSQPEEAAGPRVSAILVVYNQAAALRRAIQALEKSKDRERLEILVVDCGSRDESARIDEEFPAVQVLRLPHHLGATRAMNIAMRTAKGDLLLFLSPNVEVEPGTVAALANVLEPESDLAAVCPLLVDAEDRTVTRLRELPSREALRAAVRGAEWPGEVPDLSQDSIAVAYPALDAVMVRKVFLRGMNYFDQRFGHYWADADLALQIRRASKKVRVYPKIRARVHPEPDPVVEEDLARADCVSGAAALIGKYEGFFAGMLFRLAAAFSSLARLDLGQFSAVLAGRKLDGSQGS
jgi:hypothetical protein